MLVEGRDDGWRLALSYRGLYTAASITDHRWTAQPSRKNQSTAASPG
jgi:hypothetical protein